jgi:hypothetical protein
MPPNFGASPNTTHSFKDHIFKDLTHPLPKSGSISIEEVSVPEKIFNVQHANKSSL